MGEWEKIDNTSTHNIPATSRTYNSDPYYIGLLKNGKLNTTEAISDLTITKSVEQIKDAYIDHQTQTQSPNDDYYQLTYEVEENSDTSERVGYISITHNAVNKTLKYIIKQAANTTQEPTEPTLNEYVFQITKYNSNKNYVLQVCGHSADPNNNVSFASINTGNINDSTSLNIDIKIASAAANDTTGKNPTFNFIIIGDGFEFDSSIDNPRPTGDKLAYIIHNGKTKGDLRIWRSTTVNSGLDVHINISSNNQDPKPSALLSEDIVSEGLSDNITGKIAIKNSTHVIPFVVTFGFS